MRNVMYVDFETDIIDRDHARPVQVAAALVAYPDPEEENADVSSVEFESLLDPESPISPEAMATHRIEQWEVKGKPRLSECQMFVDLLGYADYLCAHHGREFDFHILRRELPDSEDLRRLMSAGAWIDTLTLSRKAYPDFPEHKLAGLAYRLELIDPKDRKSFPFHSAGSDVVVCRALIERVMADFGLKSIADLYDYEKETVPATVMPFGKEKGRTLEDLRKNNPGFLKWCLEQSWFADEWPDVFLGVVKETMPERFDEARERVACVKKSLL